MAITSLPATTLAPRQAGYPAFASATYASLNQLSTTMGIAPLSLSTIATGQGNPAADITQVRNRVSQLITFVNGLDANGIYARAFGAKGDGTTDDTNALRTAVTAAASQGKTLYVDPGTYLIRTSKLKSSSITIGVQLPSNLKMRGAGVGATVFKAMPQAPGITYTASDAFNPSTDGAFCWPLYSVGASNIDIAGFSVDGNLANQPYATLNPYTSPWGKGSNQIEIGAVYFEGGTNNRCTNATAYQCNGYGFRWDSSTNGYGNLLAADNCVNGGLGFSMLSNSQQGCEGTVIENFIFNDNHSDNIRFQTNSVIVRHGTASFSKRNPGTYADGLANFAGGYFESSTNCTLYDVRFEGNSSFGVDMNRGFSVGGFNNPLSTLSSSMPGNTVEACQFIGNANGGGRVVQNNSRWIGNYISDNGQRALDGFIDNIIYNPYGLHIVAGITNVTVQDNIFRCTNGKQLAAISPEGGSGNFTNCFFSGNHATGQALFNIGQIDPSNNVVDNFPVAQNGYTRVTTPRGNFSPAAYAPLTAAGTGDRTIQWDLQATPNGTYTIPAGTPAGVYGVQLLNAGNGPTGQLQIINNSSTTQQFAIPGEANHYIFGSPTKTINEAPGEKAYFELNVYTPANGNYANWFYQSLGGGMAISDGTIIRYDDARIKRTDLAGGTPFTENTQFDVTYIYGSGNLTLEDLIPAGLSYRIKALKSEFFGAFHLKENGVEVATPDQSLPDGAGFQAPAYIYVRPTALTSAINKIDLSFATVGKSYSFLQIEFFKP